MYTEERPSCGRRDTHTHTHTHTPICSIQKFNNQLGLTAVNCSMLQLVVCSSPDSGCGFVVVAVLFSSFAFRSVFFSVGLRRVDGRVTVDCVDARQAENSSPGAKAGHSHVWTPEVPDRYVQLCLLNYFCITDLTFCLLWFLQSVFCCRNRSPFLCIVSSITVINTRVDTQNTGVHPKISSVNPSAVFRASGRRDERLPRSLPG